MLGLIPSPTSFLSRTAHRKGARRAENHFHTDRSHGVALGVPSTCRGVSAEVTDPKSLLTTTAVVSIVQRTVHIRDTETGLFAPAIGWPLRCHW